MKVESSRLFFYPISDDEMKKLILGERNPELRQAYSEMLQGCVDEPEKRIWRAVWQMELKDQPGVVVGDFSFKGLGQDGTVEIGYGLREGYCGFGYMTETLKRITEWALSQEGVTRVEAETERDNLASQKVLFNAGFAPTGELGEEGPRFAYRPCGE